jgi:Ca2+-binding RTX toxin-like protein
VQDIVLRYDPQSAFSTTVTGASPLRFFAGSASGGLTQDAGFLSPNVSPTNVGKIVAADLNGDGRPDVVVAGSGQDPYLNGVPVGPTPGEVAYVLASSQGHLGRVTLSGAQANFGHHAVVGDINNDGRPDVFIDSINTSPSYFIMGGTGGALSADYSRLSAGIQTYRVTTTSTFPSGEPKTQAATAGTASALIDANQDGYLDLAILPSDGTPVGIVYLNDRTGHFSEASKITLPAGPFGTGALSRDTPNGPIHYSGTIYLDTGVADINGDGRDDLISIVTDSQQTGSSFAYYRGAKVQVLISTGSGFVDESSRVTFDYAPTDNYTHYYALRMDDINADGFKDIILYRNDDVLYRNADIGPTAILLNNGKGQFSHVAYPAGLPDGDLVVLDAARGEYAILHSTKDGTTDANGYANYVQSVDAAHFDWSKGLDLFTGLADGRGAVLTADLPGRWVHGTNVDNTITLSTGAERGFGYGGNDTINGGDGADTIDGGEGTNYLRGDAGNDSIVAGSGFNDINGNMGNDTIVAGSGESWVVGGKDNDSLSGGAGENLVYGNLGSDTCDGGGGNDVVRGGQDNDVVRGGAGNDYVSGDRGDDTVTGGTGADSFHTFGEAGVDRVMDFSRAEGDRVQLDAGTTYTVAQVGADTVISMTGGGQMTLVGVQMSSLTTGWIFGA